MAATKRSTAAIKTVAEGGGKATVAVLAVQNSAPPAVYFEKFGAARAAAAAALSVAMSYTTAAANEPQLSGLLESSFPPFQWKRLHRRQNMLLEAMRRIDMDVRRLRCPLQSEVWNARTLITGSVVLRQVGEYMRECAECYKRHEQDIYAEAHPDSERGKRKRAAIVRVSATFLKWKAIALRCRQVRFAFFEEVIQHFDTQNATVQQQRPSKLPPPITPLEQHNQLLIEAIEEAALEAVEELGAIGNCLESIFLLKYA